MPRRSVLPGVLALTLFVTSAACGDDSNPAIPSPTPTPGVTETFPGTINVNGAMTFPFTIATGGLVTATLTAIGPDSTTQIGMSIGTFNNSVCTVGTGLFLDKTVQGASIIASVTAPGTLCLRVYDAGTLTGETTFSVDVVHP
jgi:hypothetical protein